MANSTVTDALTKIFLALGGDTQKLQDDHNLTDYLDDLGDALVDAVKAELPAVTSSDNGNVLTVVNGEWVKSAPASGLPSVSKYDEGKMLTVDKNGKWSAYGLRSFHCQVEKNYDNNTYTAQLAGMPYTSLNSYAANGITVLNLSGWGGNCSLPYVGGNNSARKYAGIVYDSSEFYAVIIECTENGCTIDVEKLST